MSNSDYQIFEEFINGFTDDEFDEWMNGEDTTWKNTDVKGASNRQAEFAKTLRTPISEQEEEDIEREQESIEREAIQRLERMPVRTFRQPEEVESEEIPEQLRPTIDILKVVERPVILNQNQPIVIDESRSTAQRISLIQRLRAFFSRFRRNR